ncbi:MAG TPA: patatin-like phospholipase family protein, partial [Herpetosiphonaceae bacterium]|nr:patatin-like phospholipase family protein [Herpetosiphonaceae bacterium]
PAGAGAAPAGFAVRLAQKLAEHGPTLHLSSERFDAAYGKADAAQTDENDPTNLAVAGWLNDQEASHRYVVYETDATWSAWTQRCLRQADRVVLVGQAGRAAVPGEIEAAMRPAEPRARMELVLVQPEGNGRPTGTAAWLAERRVAAHHHLRMSSADDFRRLARRLAGRAVGLVFSGGGARGFAQIGAIRALEEAGLRADLVGGTSIGALIGAMYAMGADYAHLHKVAEALASPKRLLDRTLPLASFMASAKVTSVYRRIFDDARIEDLRRPYFCVSTNLTRAEPVVHEQGLLWEALRASTAIPGIFAPFLHKGDVVVDGGVMNHFPVDLMRERCEGGMLIAVNTSPRSEKLRNYEFGSSISGWRVLRSRLNPLERTVRVPSIFSTLTRATEVGSVYRLPFQEELADLLILPPVEQFRTLDFAAYAESIDVGYHAARQQIEAWQQTHAGVGS